MNTIYTQLLFIDPTVPQRDVLIKDLPNHIKAVYLDAHTDATEQITTVLQQHQNLEALHIVTHGAPGQLVFSNSLLNTQTLEPYHTQLASWSQAMSAEADILLYGCETGKGTEGRQFLQELNHLISCNVAASATPVGYTHNGEQWSLEQTSGCISTSVFISPQAQQYWFHTLATPSDQDFDSEGTSVVGNSYTLNGITYTTSPATNSYTSIQPLSANYAISGSGTDKILIFNNDGGNIDVGAADFRIASSDGSEFKIVSMEADAGFGQGTGTSYTVKGYRNGTEVASDTIDFTSNDAAGSVSYTNNGAGGNGGSLTFNTDWENIDEIRFTGTDVALGIDVLDFSAAVVAATDPTITDSTYDASTGVLVVTGTNFAATGGATNDVVANKFTLTGEGGATYMLTDTANVEIDSATQFTLTLSATDKAAINQMLNKDGGSSTGGTTYDLDGAAGFIAASGAIADTGVNPITASNVSAPTISSATFDYSSGALVVTGTGFLQRSGATNDIDVTKLTLTGEAGGTYTLTSSDVEITDGTQFTVNLNTTDLNAVRALLNKDGLLSDDISTYNIAAAEDWNRGADAAVTIADTNGNGITVSNYTAPTITSATYDYNSNQLVLTGTNFVAKSGATNDVDVSLFTITGEGGATYTLTSAADVDISSATSATITLSGADIQNVEVLLNNNGTTSATAGTTFNLAAADNWMAGGPSSADLSDATTGVTVSNYAVPVITSATFNYDTGVLTATGTNFVPASGATNDIDVTKLTLTGEGSATYTLTGSNVEITSSTQFSVTLAGSDLINARTLLNKDGTASATSSTTFNLAAAEDWMTGAPAGNTITDATSGITVSNYTAPAITSTIYDASTGVLVLTGTHFVGNSGSTNDIDASLFTFTGEDAATYTLTDTTDVEITSGTEASITLSATDKLHVNGLLNANGTTSNTSNTTYNVAAAEDWMAGAPAANNIVDATTGVTVSNVAAPTLSAVAYDFSAGTLTLTGSNFVAKSGAINDVDVSLFTITGEAGGTRVLTSNDVEVTSATSATITLNAADKLALNGLLNKDGASSADATTYNLAVADDWIAGALAGDTNITTQAITVSNYTDPILISAAFDFSAGTLVLTGTNFVAASGANNDVDASKLSITGSNGDTYTLTSNSVEITDGTTATVTLNASDLLSVRGLLDKNGTSADDATVYNIAAAEDWMAGAPAANTIADLSGNAITVSNYAAPAVTSATYDSDSGVLTVTGTNFVTKSGAANDVDISTITLTGGTANATYTLTSASDIEITNTTTFSVTLTGADKTSVDALLDQIGTTSSGGSTYNIGVADDWMTAANGTADIADATGNAVTVSIAPKITSATYDATTGALIVTGTNIQANGGGADIDASTLTLTGEGGATYTLTDTADVERDSVTQFTLSLSATDKAEVNQILNKSGTTSTGSTTYNIASADDWNTNASAGDTSDLTGNGVTVSNVPAPSITSATYDAASGALVVTGTGFTKFGGGQDIDASLFTFTGESGETYTLVGSSDVEITSGTSFTITLGATDKAAVNLFINKAGTTATDGTTYNLAAAEDWGRGADAAVVIADTTGNGLTVSNVPTPSITSATYSSSTGTLVVTGINFVKADGSANDIDVSTLTFVGEGNGNYTLTDSADVEITSATEFSVTLSATDKNGVEILLNKSGTSSNDSTTYNLAAADNWATGADAALNIEDLTANGITATLNTAPTASDTTESVSFNGSYTFQ
ncbi:DUF4347 domain-containing protein, partial [Terasakiella pusilla]|uniref:DUF4347 domain-containing protein n=1 Tax=Terasakiella pusilla TaxID=64973 RepID=UPI003AA8B593